MNATSEKQKMLDFVQHTFDDLMAFVSDLSEEEKKAKGNLKLWSAKDMLVHLNFWGRHFNTQLEKMIKGEKIPNAGDYLDQVNDGVLYEHLNQPLENALNEYKQIHNERAKMIKDFTEEDLIDPKKYTWLEGRPMIDRIIGNAIWHPESHIADYFVKRHNLDLAAKMQEALTEKLKEIPSWSATAVYNLACFYALNGMQDKAIPCLKEAFNGRPDLIEWSKQDSDLNSLRELPEFKALY